MARSRTVTYPAAGGVAGVQPGRAWGEVLTRLLGFATLGLMLVALYLALVYAPREATQGDVQRIFYFHVPSAWVGFLAFFVVLVGSVMYLWRRSEWWDRLARSSAEIGLLFTTIMLVTGSIWGRAVWGTWWSWDPKLTTSLILWFIYLGYLMLRAYAPTREQGARYGAVVGIVGFVDVPIVYMAATWARALHPTAQIVADESTRAPGQVLLAFFVSFAAFTLMYVYMLIQRVTIARLEDEIIALGDEDPSRGGLN